MRLHHLHAQSRTAGASGRLNKGCCSADDVDDARMVCYELGVLGARIFGKKNETARLTA